MEALYDQEGTLCLSTCDPDEQLERRLRRGHGDLFEPDKSILQASSNFHFFSNIGSTATEEMHSPYSKHGNNRKIDIRWK
jgi:hypothetical protein